MYGTWPGQGKGTGRRKEKQCGVVMTHLNQSNRNGIKDYCVSSLLHDQRFMNKGTANLMSKVQCVSEEM